MEILKQHLHYLFVCDGLTVPTLALSPFFPVLAPFFFLLAAHRPYHPIKRTVIVNERLSRVRPGTAAVTECDAAQLALALAHALAFPHALAVAVAVAVALTFALAVAERAA